MGMIDDRHLPTIRPGGGRTKRQGDIANSLSEHWVITDFTVDGVLLSLLTYFLYSYYENTDCHSGSPFLAWHSVLYTYLF